MQAEIHHATCGSQRDNDVKRLRKSQRVQEILNCFDLTRNLVVVAGDLIDSSESSSLKSLLTTPFLFDVLKSPLLGGSSWTYHDGRQQIDYVLVSQPLFVWMTAVAIERHGLFHKTNFGSKFPPFPDVD